jgi:hypothetical protein
MKYFIGLILGTVVSNFVYAQSPYVEWVKEPLPEEYNNESLIYLEDNDMNTYVINGRDQ